MTTELKNILLNQAAILTGISHLLRMMNAVPVADRLDAQVDLTVAFVEAELKKERQEEIKKERQHGSGQELLPG